MLHHDPFTGRHALIFGGAKGIGRAVALDWARRGARLAIADIALDAAQDTAQAIVAEGGQAVALRADVLSEASVAETVAAARAALGPIDIAMNNVGGMLNGDPQDIPLAEWHRIMEINYFAAVRGVLAVLPDFLERGAGHIVNTASFAGWYPYGASRIPYTAAKAATIALPQNLAIPCEPKGVRVSCLIPGPVMTGVLDSMTSWTENCPLRGPGRETTLLLPEQLATELSEGMAAGRILIPSDPAAFAIVQRWAQDPDGFIRSKIAAFDSGDSGNPQVPEALRKLMGRN
ncbi:MAG TPA: SDR family oxidoreductase [Novosphingobium sp.]|nr:SDR family oxidoreductase [Novosphingobium sp.]